MINKFQREVTAIWSIEQIQQNGLFSSVRRSLVGDPGRHANIPPILGVYRDLMERPELAWRGRVSPWPTSRRCAKSPASIMVGDVPWKLSERRLWLCAGVKSRPSLRPILADHDPGNTAGPSTTPPGISDSAIQSPVVMPAPDRTSIPASAWAERLPCLWIPAFRGSDENGEGTAFPRRNLTPLDVHLFQPGARCARSGRIRADGQTCNQTARASSNAPFFWLQAPEFDSASGGFGGKVEHRSISSRARSVNIEQQIGGGPKKSVRRYWPGARSSCRRESSMLPVFHRHGRNAVAAVNPESGLRPSIERWTC